MKKGLLKVTDSGTPEASQVITAAGAAAIGMPSTHEEWKKAKAVRAQTAASPEPAAGGTQAEVPAAGPRRRLPSLLRP